MVLEALRSDRGRRCGGAEGPRDHQRNTLLDGFRKTGNPAPASARLPNQHAESVTSLKEWRECLEDQLDETRDDRWTGASHGKYERRVRADRRADQEHVLEERRRPWARWHWEWAVRPVAGETS